MRDLASSGLSGHKLARAASSNLCNFFCISKLNLKERKKRLLCHSFIHSFLETVFKYQPSNGGDSLTILEFTKSLCVIKRLHKNFRQFLFVLCAFILCFTMVQQHVDFRYQQRFRILELCNNVEWRQDKNETALQKGWTNKTKKTNQTTKLQLVR